MMTNCFATSRIEDVLENGCGYYTGLHFQQDELKQILNIIHEQWLHRIKQVCPAQWQKFSEIGVARYHELAHLLDHAVVWSKNARILSKESVEKIRQMSLIKKIEDEYGPIQIVDEENIGYEEIDWRLVRPNQPSDVGPFHADSWFLELGHGVKPPNNMKAIKIWVALCCESGLNGLKVVPESQKRTWRYHGEFRHGFIKPQIDEDEACLPSILLHTNPGDAILFHDKLLHAGAINRGKYTRVSMEFMVFVKK